MTGQPRTFPADAFGPQTARAWRRRGAKRWHITAGFSAAVGELACIDAECGKRLSVRLAEATDSNTLSRDDMCPRCVAAREYQEGLW